MTKQPDLINDPTVSVVLAIIARVTHNSKEADILFLKRSDRVAYMKGKWSLVAGTINNRANCPIRQAELEVIGELDWRPYEDFNRPFVLGRYEAKTSEKTWVRTVVGVQSTGANAPYLDWEHDNYLWVPVSKVVYFAYGDRESPCHIPIEDFVPDIKKDLEPAKDWLGRLVTAP